MNRTAQHGTHELTPTDTSSQRWKDLQQENQLELAMYPTEP